MRLQMAQETAAEAASAVPGFPVSQGQGRRRTRSEARMGEVDEDREFDEEDDGEDDGEGDGYYDEDEDNGVRCSAGRDGAPFPGSDSDSDFVP